MQDTDGKYRREQLIQNNNYTYILIMNSISLSLIQVVKDPMKKTHSALGMGMT
jgi:hypothetical protein